MEKIRKFTVDVRDTIDTFYCIPMDLDNCVKIHYNTEDYKIINCNTKRLVGLTSMPCESINRY